VNDSAIAVIAAVAGLVALGIGAWTVLHPRARRNRRAGVVLLLIGCFALAVAFVTPADLPRDDADVAEPTVPPLISPPETP